MSYCINPRCPQPNHTHNHKSFVCQSCGSALVLEKRYRVRRLLHDNTGFGTIYEAEHRGKLKVLKVLKQRTAKAVKLFRQEAIVLDRLNHHGIPKIDRYFLYTPKNQPALHCLLMEKIEGTNLEQWLFSDHHKQPIDNRLAITWLRQMAEILQVVHRRKYCHRDIKPANIMRRPNGQLALVDFGTAGAVSAVRLEEKPNHHNLTIVKTAGYTSLEQVHGQAVSQSDFFALGRTFVFLLTGRKPTFFHTDASNGKLLWRSRAQHVAPPLADFIDELMEPFPAQRPETARAILQRLKQLERTLASGHVSGHSMPNMVAPTLSSPETPEFPMRSWWRRLRSQGSALPKSATGHGASVQAIAFSPDSRTFVSGSWDRSLKLWHTKTLQVLRSWPGHVGNIEAVDVSLDGQWLASGSWDHRIKLWRLLEPAREPRVLRGHTSIVYAIAFSPDGQWLVSGSRDRSLRLWQVTTQREVKTFRGHKSFIFCVAYSPKGDLLVSGSRDRTIKLWRISDGNLIRTLTDHTDAVRSVTFSSDGTLLASGSDDATIKIWDVRKQQAIQTLTSHNDAIKTVAFSPDNRLIASGSEDHTIKLWKVRNGRDIRTFKSHQASINAIAFSPDGRYLASGSGDKTVKLWQL